MKRLLLLLALAAIVPDSRVSSWDVHVEGVWSMVRDNIGEGSSFYLPSHYDGKVVEYQTRRKLIDAWPDDWRTREESWITYLEGGDGSVLYALPSKRDAPFLSRTSPTAAFFRQSVTYFIATTGTNSDCTTIQTEGTPGLTLAFAMDCVTAANGDIIEVNGGDYGDVAWAPGSGGSVAWEAGTTWENALTVRPDAGETVTVSPDTNKNGYSVLTVSAEYVILDENGGGFDFDATGIGATGHACWLASDFIRLDSSGNPGGIKCHHSPVFQGILVGASGGDGSEILDVEAYNNGNNNNEHGIYSENSNVLIDGLISHDNFGYGVHVFKSGCSNCTNGTIVRNSTIYDNGADPDVGTCGIILTSGSNLKAYNNVVWGQSGASTFSCGIVAGLSTNPISNIEIYNNTLINNGDPNYQINIQSGVTGAIVKNNILVSSAGVYISDSGSGTVVANNTTATSTAALGMVDPAMDDYTLATGSNQIDTGEDLSSVFTTDYEGDTRPTGGGFDRGFDEYTTPPTVVVSFPNGGEVIEIGTTQTITWACVGVTNVVIDLSDDGGMTYATELVASTDCVTGEWAWDTTGLGADTDYRVRVGDAADDSPQDASDANFELAATSTGTITVSSPATGAYFLGGHTKPIIWSSENISGNVRIDFSCNDGAVWQVGFITASVPFDSSNHTMTVPNQTCVGAAQIRVVSLNDTSVLDVSDSFSTSSNVTGFIQ